MAISECRLIQFDSSSILRALTVVRRVTDALGLRACKIDRIKFQPDQKTVSVIDSHGTAVAELASESLAAVLVAYCSRIKVPLPRAGRKTVEITPNGVVLRVTTESRSEQLSSGDQSDFPRAMVWNTSRPDH